jgi:hypothetical protein
LKTVTLSIHKPVGHALAPPIVSRRSAAPPQTDARAPQGTNFSVVQRKFADSGCAGPTADNRSLGFDSSCAITRGHLGKKLHKSC